MLQNIDEVPIILGEGAYTVSFCAASKLVPQKHQDK